LHLEIIYFKFVIKQACALSAFRFCFR